MSKKRKTVEVTPDPTHDELSKRRFIAKARRDLRMLNRNGEQPAPTMYAMILWSHTNFFIALCSPLYKHFYYLTV